jgi:hypothetical protein
MRKTIAALAAFAVVGAAGVAFSQTAPPSCEANGVCARLDSILAKVNQPPSVTVPTPQVTVNNARAPLVVFVPNGIAGVTCGATTSGCQDAANNFCHSIPGYSTSTARVTYSSGTLLIGVICP